MLRRFLIDKLLTPAKAWFGRYVFYFKLAAVAALVFGIFWAGIEVQYAAERARDLKAAEKQAKADQAAADKMAELSTGLFAALELLRQNERENTEDLRHEVEKIDCRAVPLSSDIVRLLNE